MLFYGRADLSFLDSGQNYCRISIIKILKIDDFLKNSNFKKKSLALIDQKVADFTIWGEILKFSLSAKAGLVWLAEEVWFYFVLFFCSLLWWFCSHSLEMNHRQGWISIYSCKMAYTKCLKMTSTSTTEMCTKFNGLSSLNFILLQEWKCFMLRRVETLFSNHGNVLVQVKQTLLKCWHAYRDERYHICPGCGLKLSVKLGAPT